MIATIRRTAVSGLRVLGDLIVSFFRDRMLEGHRDGRIRTTGLPTGVRVAVGVSIAGILALLVSIAVADRWRTAFDAIVLPGGQTLRGTLIPEPMIPVTF